jgi:general stress protein YciG
MTMQSSHSAQEETWQNVVAHENPQVEDNNTSSDAEKDTQRSNRRSKGLRGFAAMDGEKQRAIASMGGRAAHQQGVAHEFSSEEARMAGKKGGEAVSRNREHMAAIGKKGGEAAHGRRRQRQESQQSAQ